jgi:hypothetical protein
VPPDPSARQAASFAFDNGHTLTKRMRHEQDIGKQDRGVETEATDRLQRDLSRPFGVEAEIEKACGLLAQSPVFGKVPPGLPHQPKRRNGLGETHVTRGGCAGDVAPTRSNKRQASKRISTGVVRHFLVIYALLEPVIC